MGFLRGIFGGKSAGVDTADRDGIHFYVRCDRCGERIHIRANRTSDVADEYDGEAVAKILHKEVLGSRCQNLMYVHLTLDAGYRIVESSTERCALITREAFEAEA